MQADLKMQYSSQAMATGKTAFLKNSLMASRLVIGGASIPASIIPGKSDCAQGLWKVRQSAQSMLFQLSNMTKVHFEKRISPAILTAQGKECIITVLYHSVMWREIWKKR